MQTISEVSQRLHQAREEMHKGIVGQDDLIDGLLVAMISNGHVLIEGLPGLAKTRAVNLLSQICKVQFNRIQFTPDLLPADVVGTRIFNQNKASFENQYGPIFGNFILADEINRAPAKVQSALLEAMQERQITVGDVTKKLPEPFLVFATQNPIEQEGTYPLPEAQLDRFLLKLLVGYPKKEEEAEIVRMVVSEINLPVLSPIFDPKEIIIIQEISRKIHLDDSLIRYIAEIVLATRNPEEYKLENYKQWIYHGASPRASIALAQTSRAVALLNGRDFTTAEDIRSIAMSVLRHRVVMNYMAEAEGITSEQFIDNILSAVKAPS
ncbi:AAA family ATPase [Leptospira sp. GIMC2001]|uniref:AAA family ATPase n=1 Tax=Leptospira sp. GIMC2001 TaxID=1513297 RepID=UPI0023495D8F|nr:MoxR family ATPase [Leptospira sp. GIMC2001]WCL48228.1 MoxR family ATPase [Leptospira sp. GIMC2001]